MFINLSNHPVAKWSPEQVKAAKELGFGDPQDYPMPVVPPLANESEVQDMAATILMGLPAEIKAAHVSGEYALTFKLVRLLMECEIPCFVATTARVTKEEIQPDLTVKKVTVFKFCQWRQYL